METGTPFDYLVIGHVTHDRVADGFRVGGTAAYAARTAYTLGCRVGVITSVGVDLDLDPILMGISVACIPSKTTTTFENRYTPLGRRQILHHPATTIEGDMWPLHWRAAIVHIGPVAGECAPSLLSALDRPGNHPLVGITPQGWMRRCTAQGDVLPRPWEGAEADAWLRRADAVVVSDEDVQRDPTWVARYAPRTSLLVITHGADGCTVYHRGESCSFLAPSVPEVDPTGAGDIFAATFFIALQRTGDPWQAARLANCLAAHSVTRSGLESIPTPEEIARCFSLKKRCS